MSGRSKGFSLIELMAAMAITLGIGVIVFEIFRQNARVFRDENLVVEAQQTARVVAAQIADEIRMAGQGVPVYASRFDGAADESTAVILNGSNSSRINFRAGLSNAETYVTEPLPLDLTIGTSRAVAVAQASLLSSAFGTASPGPGRFVYIWGPTSNEAWTWVRAEISNMNNGANTLTLTALQAGEPGRLADDVVRFTASPAVALEEAIAFYIESGSVKRATATNMAGMTSPVWSAGSEIGRHLTSLEFTYFDKNGAALTPASLIQRASIVRVDVGIVVETSEDLGSGRRGEHRLSIRTIPRNLKIR